MCERWTFHFRMNLLTFFGTKGTPTEMQVLRLLSVSLRVALAPRQIMSGLGTRRLPGAAHLCDTKKLNAEKDGW